MTTKQVLPVVLALWCGLALWTLRSLHAHSLRAEAPSEDRDDDDEEDADDRALTSVWSAHDEAFAVGERGAIYHSGDGGRVWVRQETGVDEDLHAVFGARGQVFAVGDGGRILHQRSEGVWEAQVSGVEEDLHAIWGSGTEDLWAAGDSGVVLHSRDGGASWRRVDSGTEEDLRAIAGAPGGVYVSGENGVLKKLSPAHAVSTTGGAQAPQG